LPQRKPWLGFYGSRLLADYRSTVFDYLLLLPGKKKAPKGGFPSRVLIVVTEPAIW
jgi:hypothetical protein